MYFKYLFKNYSQFPLNPQRILISYRNYIKNNITRSFSKNLIISVKQKGKRNFQNNPI